MAEETPGAASRRLRRRSTTEQPFQVRPGGKKPSRAPKALPSVARLISRKSRPPLAARPANTSPSGTRGAGVGRSASRLRGRGLLDTWSAGHPRRQRVVVKARVSRNVGKGGRRTLGRHVDYVEREGVDEQGGPGQSFGRDGLLPDSDVRAFVEAARDERHHFRIIVTPERGGALNLRRYTQELVTQVEADLRTELRWLAVEHHNTAHPHVHLIVRGVDAEGADLVISRTYLSQGLRERAQGLATQALGLRPERELTRERAADVRAERFTYLDRRLLEQAQASDGLVDVRPPAVTRPGFRETFRAQTAQRLETLSGMDLATEEAPGRWRLDPDLESTLRTRGQQAALGAEVRERLGSRYRYRTVSIYHKDAPPVPRLEGEVVDRRRVDEISETDTLLVVSPRGHLYRVPLSPFSELPGDAARSGDFVAVTVTTRPAVSGADRTIARLAKEHDGIYDAARHREAVLRDPRFPPDGDPDSFVANHVKRLEGHVRRGQVEAIDTQRFRIPDDLLARLEASKPSARDAGGVIRIERLSALSLKEQVRARGVTWLDTQLVTEGPLDPSPTSGTSTLERRLVAAGRARRARLQQRGLLEGEGASARVTRGTLERLYIEDVSGRGAELSGKYGTYHPATERRQFIGTVERLEPLSSGLHAVVRSGEGFTLVPAGGALGVALSRQIGRRVDLQMDPGRDAARLVERNIRFVALEARARDRALTR